MTNPWPALPVANWEDTRDTLHLWTQIVGKVRLALAAPVNHWWHVTLYVTPRGLTTSLMPTPAGGLELTFDFAQHVLVMETTDRRRVEVALAPRSVASFYAETMGGLASLGVAAHFVPRPAELATAIPFAEDEEHASYDRVYVERFWQSLVDAQRVMQRFRGDFFGKASPVHFFWGAFDLATTRFSERRAPQHPGGIPNCPDWVMHEAYNRELSSAGYWPGGSEEGTFYSYAYPEPSGYRDAALTVPGAAFDAGLGEYVLPYAAVRAAADPDQLLFDFLQETYAAAASAGAWDRAVLERD